MGQPSISVSIWFLIKAIKFRRLGNVSLNTRNVGAHCLHGLNEFHLAAVGDEDKGALCDEQPCRR